MTSIRCGRGNQSSEPHCDNSSSIDMRIGSTSSPHQYAYIRSILVCVPCLHAGLRFVPIINRADAGLTRGSARKKQKRKTKNISLSNCSTPHTPPRATDIETNILWTVTRSPSHISELCSTACDHPAPMCSCGVTMGGGGVDIDCVERLRVS